VVPTASPMARPNNAPRKRSCLLMLELSSRWLCYHHYRRTDSFWEIETMNEQEVSPRRSDRHDPDLSQKTLRVPIADDAPIASIIDPLAKTGDLYETLADDKVLCFAKMCRDSEQGI